MPIHVRAEPGEYAEACLLPGDPLRAKYIAETYLDNAVQRNTERGMLGYTGEFEGRPVSVQATGMGCPSAAIVIEELVQLGVKRMLRVGTCGGLQPDLQLGDLIVALAAIPADATARHLVGTDQHVPTASWELVHGAVHVAKEIGQAMRIGLTHLDTFSAIGAFSGGSGKGDVNTASFMKTIRSSAVRWIISSARNTEGRRRKRIWHMLACSATGTKAATLERSFPVPRR